MGACDQPRFIELYAGLGGVSTAWPEGEGVAAYDINRNAQLVFQANHQTPYHVQEIESLPLRKIAEHDAELWWLSPPCQPFTRKGSQRGAQDSRASSFARWLANLDTYSSEFSDRLPGHLVVENVVGFEGSELFDSLHRTLESLDYRVRVLNVCPTIWGWPNRRPRVYVVATRAQFVEPISLGFELHPLTMLEDTGVTKSTNLADLELDPEIVRRYAGAFDVVDAQGMKPTACFTSSYGKALLRSGSYLALNFEGATNIESHQEPRLRYFSPREVARLLGFPDSFSFAGLANRAMWKLLGNSLSLPAVRYALSHFENGPRKALPWWPSCQVGRDR